MEIFNIVNFVFYMLLLLSIIFSHCVETERTKKLYLKICFVLMWGLAAFRYTPQYADYANYRIEYIKSADMSLKNIMNTKAPVMFLINHIMNKFSTNPQTFFVITSFVIIFIVLRFIYRHSSNIYISLLAFWGLLYWNTSINIVRQYLAIAVFLVTFEYIIKEKLFLADYLKIGVLTILGMGFHYSAIIIIFAAIILRMHISDARGIGVLIKVGIIYAVMVIGINIGFSIFYSYYGTIDGYGQESANILGLIVPGMIVMLAIMKREMILQRNTENRFFVNAGITSVIFSLMSIAGMLILARCGTYFSILFVVLIPEVIGVVFERFYYRSQTSLFAILIFIYYMFMNCLGKVPMIYQLNMWIFGGIVTL